MLIFPHTLYLLPPLISGVVLAQSMSLPSTGVAANLTKERPYEERVSLARTTIDIAVSTAITDAKGTLLVHDLSIVTPVLYSQMAEFDILTHNTTYRDFLQVYLPQGSAEILNSSKGHGYAAVKAYIAYKDDRYLTLAQQYWNAGRAQCISDEDIQAKSISTKSSSLRTECNGKSLLGGVFANNNLTNGLLEHRVTSGLFTLSALLAEVTSDNTYTKVANQTLQFLKNFSYFPHSNGPENEKVIFALDSDPPCLTNSIPSWYPDTGSIIEGLSILASINNDSDTSIEGLLSGRSLFLSTYTSDYVHVSLQDAINSSTIYRDTKELDGVLRLSGVPPGFPLGDPYLVRGLATAYRRNHVDSKVSGYVKEFIAIQYNVLLDSSTQKQSGIFTDPVSGPPQRGVGSQNQTYAAMVFVQDINLVDSVTGGGNTPSSRSPPETKKAAKTGEIVGEVVGGVAFALLSGLAAFIFIRRCRRRRTEVPSIHRTSPFHLSGSPWADGTTSLSPISPIIRVKPRLSTQPSTTQRDSTVPTTSPISRTSRRIRGESRLNSPNSPQMTYREPQLNVLHEIGSGAHERFNAMSTTEMARALNARLQAESDSDMPPAYPQSQIGI